MLIGLVSVVVAGCSGGGGDSAITVPGTNTVVRGGMRPVPTVVDGEGMQGVVSGSVPSGPPPTEVVGDPKPDPDSPVTLPDLPDAPAIDVCAVLVERDAESLVSAGAGGASVRHEAFAGIDSCRLSAGSVVAEVQFVSEDVVNDDWYRREGIEPVGELGGEAVGIVGTGYTIAMISRRQGAVITVRGAADARSIAVALGLMVEAST